MSQGAFSTEYIYIPDIHDDTVHISCQMNNSIAVTSRWNENKSWMTFLA